MNEELRAEFRDHVPYEIESDRTFRQLYFRWACPCGEHGPWTPVEEQCHDGHKRHVAEQLQRCPVCMRPFTIRVLEEDDQVRVMQLCPDHGIAEHVRALSR
jgi:hypothetical protein